MSLDHGHRVKAAPVHVIAPTTGSRAGTPLRVGVTGDRDVADIVDEWGAQSFPASDPPANW